MKSLPQFVQRHRKAATWSMLAMLGVLTLVSNSAWPEHHPFHEAAEVAALFVLVAGLMIRLTSIAFVGGRKGGQVVDVGPYSLVRNPLYVGSLLILAAAGLSFGSVMLALIYVFAGWSLFTCLVLAEEAHLRADLGGTYEAYATRTPRWLPRSLSCVAPTTWVMDVRAVSLALREGLAFFMLVPLEEAIEWAHAAGWLPMLVRLY